MARRRSSSHGPERLGGGAYDAVRDGRDDRGVKQVTFFLDGEAACVDATAPYTCVVEPGVRAGRPPHGRRDRRGQRRADQHGHPARSGCRTGSAARPDAARRLVAQDRDRGRAAPAARRVDDRDGCRGKVEVTLRRRGEIVDRDRVKLGRDCRYDAKLQARDDGRHRVTARFLGNDVLRPVSAEPTG